MGAFLMNISPTNKEDLRPEAERLNTMINTLTLFTRRTTLEWLPEILSKTGITREEINIMFELSIEPNQSLKQLSRNIMASASNVSVLIQSMVEGGVVNRIADPKDRRRVLLSLSEKGQKLFYNVQEDLLERYQDYLRGLQDSDQEDLNQATLSMLMVMERLLNRTLVSREKPNM